MKAIQYEIEIQLDGIHSWGDHYIREIFIPDLKICFNEEGYVFRADKKRERKNRNEKNILILNEDAKAILSLMEKIDLIPCLKEKLFPGNLKVEGITL